MQFSPWRRRLRSRSFSSHLVTPWIRGRIAGIGRRRLFESLELRRMLANYTWNDAGNTLAIHLESNESLTITPATGIAGFNFNLSAGGFAQSGGNTANGSGTGSISISAADLTTSIAVDNTLAAFGTNNVVFDGGVTLTSGSVTVQLDNANADSSIFLGNGFDL